MYRKLTFPTKLSILQHLRTLPVGTRIRLEGVRNSEYALILWKENAPYTAVRQNGDICEIGKDELLRVLWTCRNTLRSPSTFIGALPLPDGDRQAYRTADRACLARSLKEAEEVLGPQARLLTCPGDDLYFKTEGGITSILREALLDEAGANKQVSHA